MHIDPINMTSKWFGKAIGGTSLCQFSANTQLQLGRESICDSLCGSSGRFLTAYSRIFYDILHLKNMTWSTSSPPRHPFHGFPMASPARHQGEVPRNEVVERRNGLHSPAADLAVRIPQRHQQGAQDTAIALQCNCGWHGMSRNQ